jgi:hypothetical protein
MKPQAKYLLTLITTTLLLGGLITAALTSPVWYDDAGHYLVAREIARGHGMCYPLDPEGITCIPNSPFITMGPVQAHPLGVWLKITGDSMRNARIFAILLALLTTIALFALARSLTKPPQTSSPSPLASNPLSLASNPLPLAKPLTAILLIALNIQFLTYGAQALGEVPMMGFILTGILCFIQWDKIPHWSTPAKWLWAIAGITAWCLAIGIKEYALFPLAWSLLIWWVLRIVTKSSPSPLPRPDPSGASSLSYSASASNIFLLGLLMIIALALTLFLLHAGPQQTIQYFRDRSSYGSEFLALNLAISLKYLALKPLFWLGTAAMVLKYRIKRRKEELLTLSVQSAFLIFYLLSAGYDRFGFLLLFLPAIYLAEFAPYLWKEAGRNPHRAILRRTVLILLTFLVFSQQTWLFFGKRIANPGTVNAIEKAALTKIDALNPKPQTVVTAEQQMALFLPKIHQNYRLVSIVPSMGEEIEKPIPDFFIGNDDILLAGPYAFTEFYNAIDWTTLEPLDSLKMNGEKWVIYRNKP